MDKPPPTPVKITTTIRLDPDLHERVARAATVDHRSFNNEVVALLEAQLNARDSERANR